MKMTTASLALISLVATAAVGPQPEVHTGTNTNRETAQTHYGAPGSPFPERTEVQPTDEALVTAREMARCAVSQDQKDVKAALGVQNKDDFRAATRKFSGSLSNCLAYSGKKLADFSQFAFAPHSLAGLLAEAMFQRSGFPTLTAAKFNANAPKLDWMASSDGSLVELRLGECLAETQPTVVAALVGATPSSPQELSAFQALVPFIPACLDKNVTLKATRSSLRLALAFALYRRTIQPAAVAAGAEH